MRVLLTLLTAAVLLIGCSERPLELGDSTAVDMGEEDAAGDGGDCGWVYIHPGPYGGRAAYVCF